MTLEKIARNLDNLGLSRRYWRAVGDPEQVFVKDIDAYFKRIELLNGNRSVFTTVNSFPRLYYDTKIRRWAPYEIRMERIMTDVDTLDSHVYKKVCKRIEKHDLPFASMRTGGNGWQFQTAFKHEKFQYEKKSARRTLYNAVAAVNDFLFNRKPDRSADCYIEGIDAPVSNDPRRIGRTPGCIYFNQDGLTRSKSTVIVKPKHYEKAEEMSKNNISDDVYLRGEMTLTKFIEENNIFVKEVSEDIDMEYDKAMENPGVISDKFKYLELICMRYPCIAVEMDGAQKVIEGRPNPYHLARMTFAVFLFKIGKVEAEVNEIYDGISEMYNYADREDTYKKEKNIASLSCYTNTPTCFKIKKVNLCIRELCPRYNSKILREEDD